MAIHKIACLGSGLIGSSWATLFSREGYSVNLYDIGPAPLEKAKANVKNNLKKLVDFDIITDEAMDAAYGRISFHSDLAEAVKDADFIQECSPEVLETKRQVLDEVDRYNAAAIFASSSSALRISDIAERSAHPERCIGAHPYNPPHLIPLVELTKGKKTDGKYIREAYEFYKTVRKEPVILYKEAVGFIANRLQAAYTREMIDIVMKGICSVEDVDKASLYGLGFRYAIIGPNLNGDLNGGEGGLRDYYRKYGAGVFEASFKDGMGTWTELPQEFCEHIGPEGVNKEKANRPKELGNTREEIIAYRDRMLIEILKLHKKV